MGEGLTKCETRRVSCVTKFMVQTGLDIAHEAEFGATKDQR
jgi:hypothetical protein